MTPEPRQTEVTAVLASIRNGVEGATDRLFGLVYEELKELAHGRMRAESPGHVLQTTALVNEAYLRLCRERGSTWENRRHFFGAAARAMRQILVDSARERIAMKREGGRKKVTLDHNVAAEETPVDLIALDQALGKLGQANVRAADVVKYRYFLGLTVEETGHLLEVSPRTVNSDWQLAKAWLRREISRGSPAHPD